MKKESFCSNIFNGLIFPVEMLTVNNPEYDQCQKKHQESENEFLSKLDKKQIELYEKAQDDYMDYQNALIERAFKLGLKYAFEIMSDLQDIEFKK